MSRPVVLVHGFATSSIRTWSDNGWVDLIGDLGREVHAPDLLGHGDAPKPHDPEAYDAMHRLVLDGLPDEPVDAVGFSLGSRLLLMAAAEAPERFNSLILTATGKDVLHTQDAIPQIADALLTGEGDTENPVVAYFQHLAQAPGVDRAALAAVLRRPSNVALTPDLLARVSVPVTIVVGDRDFAGPGEPLAELLPRATVITVRGVDHFSTPKSFEVIDTVLRLLDAPIAA